MTSHETTASRQESVNVVDRVLFVDSWYESLARGDPYFNPNFSRENANYTARA